MCTSSHGRSTDHIEDESLMKMYERVLDAVVPLSKDQLEIDTAVPGEDDEDEELITDDRHRRHRRHHHHHRRQHGRNSI